MSPFDGSAPPLDDRLPVNAKWPPDDVRWKRAAEDLSFELQRLEVGRLSRAESARLRRVLLEAFRVGAVQPDAAHNARRLAMTAWGIVAVRFETAPPRYPKSHRGPAMALHRERLRAWESALDREIRRRCAKALENVGVTDLAGALRALRPSRGPTRSALSVAHRVAVGLAKRSKLEFAPRITPTLTPRLAELLEAHAPKPLLRKRLAR